MKRKLLLAKAVNADDWTAFNSDTTGVDVVAIGVCDKKAVQFDKVNGAANTVFGAAYNTSVKVHGYELLPEDYVMWTMYCSAATNVAYAFLRLGTSSTNYCEYRYADSSMISGGWTLCRKLLGEPSSVTGSGLAGQDMTYLVVGLAFDLETHALANIAFSEAFTLEAEFTG